MHGSCVKGYILVVLNPPIDVLFGEVWAGKLHLD